jgi:valyl-tRNA synthetase
MKVGRRLAIKILNASKFALGLGETGPTPTATYPLDQAMLSALADVVSTATVAFEDYDYTRALERTEAFFWSFCDDYLELVKGRAYGSQGEPGAASALSALNLALSVLQRLFAPFLPYVTEEVWSWWQTGSIHLAGWPTGGELAGGGDELCLEVAASVLGTVRRHKSEAKRSMRASVRAVTLRTSQARADALERVRLDVEEAGAIESLVIEAADVSEDVVEVILAEDPERPT